MRAAATTHLDVVRELLDRGARVNEALVDGTTALTNASYTGHLEIARELKTGALM